MLFLFALLLVAPLVCCNKKTLTPKPQPIISLADREPAWSPDGHTIAYRHAPRGDRKESLTDTFGIFLIDTSGANRRVLVPHPFGFAYDPTFSPDGHWVAFSMEGVIYKIKINGDSITKLTKGSSDFLPGWSPDGNLIVYFRAAGPQGEIRLTDKDGSFDSMLLPGIYPNWSNDGERILCITYFEQSYITIFNRNDSTFKKVKSFPGGWSDIRWSPSNDRILITISGTSGPFLYVMDTLGQSLQLLTNFSSGNADWSPDGQKIVFVDARAEVGRLVIMNSDGSNRKQLTF